MKRNSKLKLKLKPEMIRILSSSQTREVRGGAANTVGATVAVTCHTCDGPCEGPGPK